MNTKLLSEIEWFIDDVINNSSSANFLKGKALTTYRLTRKRVRGLQINYSFYTFNPQISCEFE